MNARDHAPECARLAKELRTLRECSGLSLAALAARTPYSKSSWERYLNGKALPPQQAVEALCRLAQKPERRPLALWELAESAWSRRGATPRPPASRPAGILAQRQRVSGDKHLPPVQVPAQAALQQESRTPRTRTVVAVAALLACSAVAAVTVAAVTEATPHMSHMTGTTGSPAANRCQSGSCDGKDPLAMFCGVQPTTLATLDAATGASLEIRYNGRCQATWVRAWNTRVNDRFEVTGPGRPTQTARVRDTFDATGYLSTPMVAVRSGAMVRGCLLPASGGGQQCFDGRVP